MSVRPPFQEPIFTFGIELEMLYFYPNLSYRKHMNKPADEYIDMRGVWRYVAAILMHQLPLNYHQIVPSVLGNVRTEDDGLPGYKTWLVTDDASIGANACEIARYCGVRSKEIKLNAGWDQIELISPILRFTDNWLAQLSQVHRDLSPRADLGASFNNDTTGLHVHFALDNNQNMPLLALQNLVMLWAVFESEIERMHPGIRHGIMNEYAQGLRRRFLTSQAGQIWPENSVESWNAFRIAIFAAPDVAGLRRLISPPNEENKGKYVKIFLSYATAYKPLTVEFREHRGTQNSAEIAWWVIFCRRVFVKAFEHAHAGLTGFLPTQVPPEMGNLQGLFTYIQLELEGQAFFHAKVEEYREAAGNDAEVISSDDSSDGYSPTL
jgi:hypothetical protein